MAQLRELFVTGVSRFLNNVYGTTIQGDTIQGDKLVGTLSNSDETFKIYLGNNNRINFGGSYSGPSDGVTPIYIGYIGKDSKAIPTEFIFGGSGSGTSTLKAAKFKGYPVIPVLTADPASPEVGQMWIIKT